MNNIEIEYIDMLNIITQVNLIASFLLILLVFRHYVFFSRGSTPSILKIWLKRVFLGDILMAVSVASFNVTHYFVGNGAGYFDQEGLRVFLKVVQTISVVYSGWANYGLFKYIESGRS